MMHIEWEGVSSILREAFPGFQPTIVDWDDDLSYPLMSDLIRYVDERVPLESGEAKQLGDLLERFLVDGDMNVRDLAVDAIETVWEQENSSSIASHFGPESQRIWRTLQVRT
jgi:hypothetical protein